MPSTLPALSRGLLAVAITAATASVVATPSPSFAAGLAPVTARQADSLLDAFGVNAHMEYTNTPYANAPAVAAALKTLGVRHIRDRIRINRPDQYASLRTLQAAGMKMDFIMGDPLNSGGTPAQLVDVVSTQLPGAAESLEGANEWNLKGRVNWAAELRAHQTEVYKQANLNSATANLPVLGPALGRRTGFTTLGDLSSVLDQGNVHQYPGGLQPSVHIAAMQLAEQTVSGTKPQTFTETGYNTAMADTVGNLPATEKVGGYYAPKLLLEHFNRGVKRVYNYELLDQQLDPALTNPEAAFGLLHHDMTPKPEYTSLKNLLQLVADPGPAFTPGSLAYSLAGAPSDVRQVLLQKRDGRFYLILWRDTSMWNPKTKTETATAPVNVAVNIDRTSVMSVFRPSLQQATKSVSSPTTSLSVTLADDAVAIQITPAATLAAPTTLGAPTAVTAQPADASATVGWLAPASTGGSALTGYQVTASPGGATATVGALARSARITGLTNYVGYQFTVKAISGSLLSAPSAASATVVPRPLVAVVSPGAMVLGGWTSASTPTGTVRISRTAGDFATFHFTATSVGWTSLTGPTMGRAVVGVDGTARAQVDLYRPTAGMVTTSVTGLTSAAHVLVVRVLGTRSAASSGTAVSTDSFKVGTVVTQEYDPAVILSAWHGRPASAGFHSTAVAGAALKTSFTGTQIDWVFATGPGGGQAQAWIDGVSRGVFDLYSTTVAQHLVAHFGNLAAGAHTFSLTALGTHRAGSTSSLVIVEGLRAG
ncbi:MAG: fibronectin type III domain-containing protein [Pseudonocardiales bacterium]